MGSTNKGRWSYAASKALDEFLALAYWKERKLPVVIGRFLTPVQDPGKRVSTEWWFQILYCRP